MKRSALIIFIIILLFAGIAFMLYPTLSDYWNVLHQSSATVDYANTVNAFEDGMFDEMWDRAVEYNKQLYEKSCGKYVADPIPYDSVLNVTENGMMAYIDIPKINVDDNLAIKIKNGRVLPSFFKEDMMMILDKNNNLLAIYKHLDEKTVKPYKMF